MSHRLVRHFDPGSPTAVPVNVAYRLGKIRELGLLKGDWLDVGCATGGYTLAMLDMGARTVVGVDVLKERIAEACERGRAHPAATFLQVNDDRLPFRDASFDGVFLNEVLEHVTDEVRTLEEIRRVLRPGGYLILISPNRWFPFEGHGMRLGRHQLGHPAPLLPWLPSWLGQPFMHARNYWPGELRNLVATRALVVRRVEFVWPVFEVFPWLPRPVIARYRTLIHRLDSMPFVRRFGVSTMIVACKRREEVGGEAEGMAGRSQSR
jgi:SAM-dependent methyltransferase